MVRVRYNKWFSVMFYAFSWWLNWLRYSVLHGIMIMIVFLNLFTYREDVINEYCWKVYVYRFISIQIDLHMKNNCIGLQCLWKFRGGNQENILFSKCQSLYWCQWLTFLVLKQEYLGKIWSCHDYWSHRVISNNGIDCAVQKCPCLPHGRISSTCAVSVLSSD